ncbi:MAG: glycosyltransferase family 4 protein [Bacteroidetes bacterium]|nr:glycosyltransferase family 4 protein [Bacteroidota bacterium]MBS1649683.1 glycosyltransferase family 4 protein [Bacteroidota bacterium]
MRKPNILIVGLFLNEKNKHIIMRTAADQLAELFQKHQYCIIKTSYYPNKVKRFLDTFCTILLKRKQYTIGIVPLYGGTASLLWATVSVYLLKLINKQTILIIHGGSIPERMKTKPNGYLRVIQKVDTVVCPSNFIIHHLKQYNIHALLIENVLCLTDYQFHKKNEIQPKLFWMRTFEDAYNPLMAVHVLSILKKKYSNATMVMAGRDDGLLNATQMLAHALNINNAIAYPGYITNAQKNELAEQCDVYICTNKIDNAPVTFIEMFCLGLPVVSVNSGGIPFLVKDGENALLVNYNDAEAMVEKIEWLIQHTQEANKLITNALATSRNYDEEVVVKKWEHLFAQSV